MEWKMIFIEDDMSSGKDFSMGIDTSVAFV